MRRDIKFNHLQLRVIAQNDFVRTNLARALKKLISKKLHVVLVTDSVLIDLFGRELLDSLHKEKLEPMHITLEAEEVEERREEVMSQLLDWLDTYTTVSADDVLVLGLGGSSLLTALIGAFAILPRTDLFIRPRLWLGFIPTTPKSIFITTFIGHHSFTFHGKPISIRRYPDLAIIDPSLTASLPFSKLRTSLIYHFRIALILSKGLYNLITELALDKLLVEYDKITRSTLEVQIQYLMRHCFSRPEDHVNLYRFFRVGSFLERELFELLPSEERIIYSLLFELFLSNQLGYLQDNKLRRLEMKLLEYSYMRVDLNSHDIWERMLYRMSSKIKDERYVGELTLIRDVGKPLYLEMIPLEAFKAALEKLSEKLSPKYS